MQKERLIRILLTLLVAVSFATRQTPTIPKSNNTIYIYFYIEGCPACEKVKDLIPKNAIRVKAFEPMCFTYNVTKFPTLIVVKNGRVVARLEGWKAIKKWLEEHSASSG